jgi:hypothetical protein
MNTKQKILTLVALAVFAVIIGDSLLHHSGELKLAGTQSSANTKRFGQLGEAVDNSNSLTLAESGTELLGLAVVYAGLLFLLGDRRKQPPRGIENQKR